MDLPMSPALRPVILAAALAVLPSSGFAQDLAADRVAGRRVAEHICAECHQVDEKPRTGLPGPPFVQIAAMPSTTMAALQAFLRTPHAKMPNISLSKTEIDDVTAYLMSLK
jgi:mono/diheme cytochrome c family protein